MTALSLSALRTANEQALLSLYMYLPHELLPASGATMKDIVAFLQTARRQNEPKPWSSRNKKQLSILETALNTFPSFAASRILDISRSEDGANVCTFVTPDGTVCVVFRGTGKGEWIDSGEGLSGLAEENTYFSFAGENATAHTVWHDHATDQQADALNRFRALQARHGWTAATRLILSGHSKGGNKAQFVAMHTPLPVTCFSFDAPGFSPEAIAAMKARLKTAFDKRRERLVPIAADNDYVHVLGHALAPHTHYVQSAGGFHPLEAMLDESGRLRPPAEQGRLSRYIAQVSDELMTLSPDVRQYATLGIMNILQTFLGRGVPVNGDHVSFEKTIRGVKLAVDAMLRRLPSIFA